MVFSNLFTLYFFIIDYILATTRIITNATGRSEQNDKNNFRGSDEGDDDNGSRKGQVQHILDMGIIAAVLIGFNLFAPLRRMPSRR